MTNQTTTTQTMTATFSLLVSKDVNWPANTRFCIAIDDAPETSVLQSAKEDGFKFLAAVDVENTPIALIGTVIDVYRHTIAATWPLNEYKFQGRDIEFTLGLVTPLQDKSIIKEQLQAVAEDIIARILTPAPAAVEIPDVGNDDQPAPMVDQPAPAPITPAIPSALDLIATLTSAKDAPVLNVFVEHAAEKVEIYATEVARWQAVVEAEDKADTELQNALTDIAYIEQQLAMAKDALENIQAQRNLTSIARANVRYTQQHMTNELDVLKAALTRLHDLGCIDKPSHVSVGNGRYMKIAHAQPRIIDDAALWAGLDDNTRRLFQISKVVRSKARLANGQNANDWLRSMQPFLAGTIVEYPAVTITTKDSILETGLFVEDSKE